MYIRPVQEHPLITWVLVADGKQAQIHDCRKRIHKIPLGGANPNHRFEEKAVHELHALANGNLRAETINDYQSGPNRRSVVSGGKGPMRHATEPHTDINDELKRRFLKNIVEKLEQACLENNFDRLVLVAAPKMISELQAQLSSRVTDRIVGILPKDIMQYHGQALMAHLRDTLVQAETQIKP